jgi:hypothetical protein
MAKLREANAKYKNLLKMAKERIQEQEGVLEERRCEFFVGCFVGTRLVNVSGIAIRWLAMLLHLNILHACSIITRFHLMRRTAVVPS